MRTRVEVKGLSELESILKKLGDDVAVKVLRKAGVEAMKPVLADMKSNSGYDGLSKKEHMRDSIKIRTQSRLNDNKTQTVVTVRVGPSKKHSMKARAQEFGTVKQIARPFIRSALDYHCESILNTLVSEIRASIEKHRLPGAAVSQSLFTKETGREACSANVKSGWIRLSPWRCGIARFTEFRH